MAVDPVLKQQLIDGLISGAEFVYEHLPDIVKKHVTIEQVEQWLEVFCEVAYTVCPYVLKKDPPQQ